LATHLVIRLVADQHLHRRASTPSQTTRPAVPILVQLRTVRHPRQESTELASQGGTRTVPDLHGSPAWYPMALRSVDQRSRRRPRPAGCNRGCVLRLRRRSTPFGRLPRPGPEPWRACLVGRSQTSKAREGQPSVGSNPTATALGCPYSLESASGGVRLFSGAKPQTPAGGLPPPDPRDVSACRVVRLRTCGVSALLRGFRAPVAFRLCRCACAGARALSWLGAPSDSCGVSDCRRANALVPHAASWGFGVGGRVGGFWWVGLWLVRGLFSSGLPTVHSVQAPCLDC
jgi:hypothetical protein